MKKLLLLPYSFKKVGYLLIVPFLALGIAYLFWDFTIPWLEFDMYPKKQFQISTNFTDELAAIGIIISLTFISFSKEKIEDEAIQSFRLEALQWAVWINYLVLLICILFVYGGVFLTVMTFNLFTVLIIFTIRFKYVLYQYNKSNA